MKVCVIGGGASGMIAACVAAQNGHSVILIEHNEKLGKKVYITGKGRCNLTNLCSADDFLSNVVTNSKFLFSAVKKYPPQYVYDYFENALHLPLKVERGNRVFPVSDKASDVTASLQNELRRRKVDILLNTEVISFNLVEKRIVSLTTMEDIILCDAVILATGGISYPATGSNGIGYKLATSIGHTLINPKPSLVDIIAHGCEECQGLTLKNVSAKLLIDGKAVCEQFGEMLFTHEGLSGPIILTLSAYATKHSIHNAQISINLKPALTEEQLDERLLRDFSEFNNKEVKNCLLKLLPERLICSIIEKINIQPNQKVNSITKQQRRLLAHTLQDLRFDIVALGGFERAVVTSGGISVNEINPATMQSKLCPNLYFAGEIIDVDALTGGFNLQIAFSTGILAANSIK